MAVKIIFIWSGMRVGFVILRQRYRLLALGIGCVFSPSFVDRFRRHLKALGVRELIDLVQQHLKANSCLTAPAAISAAASGNDASLS